jgi:periplasmic protein CpxP/Spy
MTTRQSVNRSKLFVGAAVLAWPLLLCAAPGTSPGPNGAGPCEAGFHGGGPRPPGPPPGPGFGSFGDRDEARPPPFLRGLKLSEDQEDKVFGIVHAAAPALRESSKALRKARDGLRELVKSPTYTAASAATLADAQGKAEGQMVLLRTRLEHDIYGVLTAAQQAEVVKREQERDSRMP